MTRIEYASPFGKPILNEQYNGNMTRIEKRKDKYEKKMALGLFARKALARKHGEHEERIKGHRSLKSNVLHRDFLISRT